ncbi:MAG: hypothetical protein AMXMBFR66_24360 [Pseudomonadota bacterium]|jgi:hypothetical protein|nr:hypothetical protein [Rubrivivax sp.]NLZ41741.1 hypothetical protein [Comamonadaceae bacterium]
MIDLLVLYLHVAAAVVLVGATVASRLAERGVSDAPDLAALRGALDVGRRTGRANPLLALVLLASGLYLGRAGLWSAPWFWLAFATWFANLVLAARVVVPARRALGAAAAQAGEGAVPTQVDALRRARAPAIAHDVMIGLDLGTLMLMLARPEPGMALLWPLLGVALSCASRVAASLPRLARPTPAARDA